MANLFIRPFEHEEVNCLRYNVEDSIQRFRRYLETLRNREYVGSNPTMGTRKKRGALSCLGVYSPLIFAVLSATGEITEYQLYR